MHNKMFLLMIFLPILRTKHTYSSELQCGYRRPLTFLQALPEDIGSDHRSCQGVQGTTAQANLSTYLLQVVISHSHKKQL